MKKNNKKNKPEGIGGWLILPTIGLFAGLLFSIITLFASFFFMVAYEVNIWFILSLLTSILFVAAIIYLLNIEFKKKKEFPDYFIAFIWINVSLTLVMGIFTEINYGELMGQFIVGIIWTLYFKLSKRVKNTFVK